MNTLAAVSPEKPALSVWDGFRVLVAPRGVFDRVEDTGAYGWTLVVLLVLVTLLGYLQMQSGLIDRLVDEQTEKAQAEYENQNRDMVDRVKMREDLESIRKGGEFTKMLARLNAVVLSPLAMLTSFLVISSVLYAVVALTGRKPEYHTLMGICVFSAFIELTAYGVETAMIFRYGTLDVATSLGMLSEPGKVSVLAALDPFRIWFWVLAGIGLTVTQQLSRRMAIVSCVLLCLAGMGIQMGMAFAAAQA